MIKQINVGINKIQRTDIIEKTVIEQIQLGNGNIDTSIILKEELFYKILTEITKVEVKNEGDLFVTINELAKVKQEYDKIAIAMQEVKQKGYGIVTPSMVT